MTGSAVFLLGAGFSAPFGVPTMTPFLSSFPGRCGKEVLGALRHIGGTYI